MITCKLQGGLGNQLFQIAATIGTAYKLNTDYCIPRNWIYAYYFKRQFLMEDEHLPIYKEKGFDYSPIDKDNVCLDGYFQTPKYWEPWIDLRKELLPNDEISEWIDENIELEENSCSIHVRRKDYTNLSDYHYNLDYDLSYYQEAVKRMGKKKFYLFSDDIEWCKQFFTDDIIFISNGTGDRQYGDVLDFFIASRCKSHIIANSSYSWWYSYLSGSKDIIAPKNWFGWKKSDHDTKDLYTDSMVVI